MAGLDTLINIETKWSLDDLMDGHEALDVKSEIERHYAERYKK